MAILLTGLMLLLAVLASNLISKLVPAASTPLVQILLGIILAFLLPGSGDFELPSELFMMLFVAPLVYADSRVIDRVTAWHRRRTILVLAIGLVLATTLVVGASMGAALEQLPFAVAFVLGAALSPTDAVAVPALAKSSSIDSEKQTVLTAESIVNDATGVVVFNLALTALVTGTFSAPQAGVSFAVLFFGGILFGILAGVLGNAVTALARAIGCDDNVFHILFDLTLPFVTFLAAEVAGVSSIMAVMVCALVFKIGIGKAGPEESRMNIVSNSVWNVLSFLLNGFVFVMLGFQLKGSFTDVMETGISTASLAGMAALLIVVVVAVRFAWLLVMEKASKRERPLKNAALLTFAGGTKGAVTMSVAMSIPYAVQSRSLVVFLVSAVIIASTVFANVFVPLLAPAPKQSANEKIEAQRRAKIDILRRVIGRLHADRTDDNGAATNMVIADYNHRIDALSNSIDDTNDTLRREVRKHALDLEIEHCIHLMEKGEVTKESGYRYLARVERLKATLDHRSAFLWVLQRSLRRAHGVVRATISQLKDTLSGFSGSTSQDGAEVRGLQRRCAEYVVEELSKEVQGGSFAIEDVTQVIMDYRRVINLIDLQSPSLTTITHREVESEKIKLKAVGYELEEIRDAQEAGTISRETAMRMRDSAYLMRLDLENVV